MPPFSPIQPLGSAPLPAGQREVIGPLIENIELLTGQRGNVSERAILIGQITINLLKPPVIRQASAVGAGYRIAGEDVVALSDYRQLLGDITVLADEIAYTRYALNVLIKQLKDK